MTDEELFTAIRTFVQPKLELAVPGCVLVQRYQPTVEGVENKYEALIHKVGDYRYGYPQESDKWDEDAQQMVHTYRQNYETTFQIGALQPNRETQLVTASDIVNEMSDILQTQEAVKYFVSLGCTLLRVTTVRQLYFQDDRDRNEEDPSFDFTVLHEHVKMSVSPIVTKYEANVKSV